MAAPKSVVSQETHQPYVPASTVLPEFSLRAVLLGIFSALSLGRQPFISDLKSA